MTRTSGCMRIAAAFLGMIALPAVALAAEPRVFFKLEFSWGPSVDPSHDSGWFDALSVTEGLAMPPASTRLLPQKAAFSHIQITRAPDRGSIALRQAAMTLPHVGRVFIEMTQPADTSKPTLRIELDDAVIASIGLATPSILESPTSIGAKEIVTLRVIPHGFIRWISYAYGPSNELISTHEETAGQYWYGDLADSLAPPPLVPGVPSNALTGGPNVIFKIDGVEHSASSFFECVNIPLIPDPSGFSIGLRTFSPFQITKAIGIDSAYLRKRLISKTHFLTVQIELRAPGTSNPIFRVTLEDATISSLTMAAPLIPGASLFDTPAVGGTKEIVTFGPEGITSVRWDFWTYDAGGQVSTWDWYEYAVG